MKKFREGRVNREQVFDMRSAQNHVAKIARSVGLKADYRRSCDTDDSFTFNFYSGDSRLLDREAARIYNTTVIFTFKDSGYTIDDKDADYDRFQGDFSNGWSEFDQDVKDLFTDMINNFSKKEMKESVIPADQEDVLRNVVKDMYPQYVGLIDEYLNNGLAGCEGAFESDNALIDDFVAYAETVMGTEGLQESKQTAVEANLKKAIEEALNTGLRYVDLLKACREVYFQTERSKDLDNGPVED